MVDCIRLQFLFRECIYGIFPKLRLPPRFSIYLLNNETDEIKWAHENEKKKNHRLSAQSIFLWFPRCGKMRVNVRIEIPFVTDN